MRNPLKIAIDYWQLRRNPVRYAKKIGVRIGQGCRLLNIHSKTFGSEPYLITIGNHVTVTSGVRFINHDGGMWIFRQQEPDIELFGPIEIGNNVFLGMNTLILPNVTIGNDCVIGAGSIVTKSIPSGSVAVGTPARVIKSIKEYRDSVDGRATFVRSSSPSDKRAALEAKYLREKPPRT